MSVCFEPKRIAPDDVEPMGKFANEGRWRSWLELIIHPVHREQSEQVSNALTLRPFDAAEVVEQGRKEGQKIRYEVLKWARRIQRGDNQELGDKRGRIARSRKECRNYDRRRGHDVRAGLLQR